MTSHPRSATWNSGRFLQEILIEWIDRVQSYRNLMNPWWNPTHLETLNGHGETLQTPNAKKCSPPLPTLSGAGFALDLPAVRVELGDICRKQKLDGKNLWFPYSRFSQENHSSDRCNMWRKCWFAQIFAEVTLILRQPEVLYTEGGGIAHCSVSNRTWTANPREDTM